MRKATIDTLKGFELQVQVRDFIYDNGVFNVSKLCQLAGIDRLQMHYFLHDGKPLETEQAEKLSVILKKFGFATKLKK